MTDEVIDDYPEPMTSAERAFQASLKLGITKGTDRSRAVLAMAQAMER
ncbi:MAG: gamma-glutamyl-phosphate reductase, partial [Dolichospermum sp.]